MEVGLVALCGVDIFVIPKQKVRSTSPLLSDLLMQSVRTVGVADSVRKAQ
jgi:hypothetical protein